MSQADLGLYCYNASLVRIVDGDTLELNIDLGFDISYSIIVRLLGINTPETHNVPKASAEYAAGKKAAEWLTQRLTGAKLRVVTKKDAKEKYGRYLATIYVMGDKDPSVAVQDEMIKLGLGKPYDGGKR